MIASALWMSVLAFAEPLQLEDVMAAMDDRVPALAAAGAKLEEAEAKLLSSRGAFDPKLVGKAKRYTGKDPRIVTDGYVRSTSVLGPTFEAGWSRGQGDFPAYHEDSKTAQDGEVRVGVEVPLLAGLGVNANRAALADAQLYVRSASALVDDKAIQVRRKAEEAWWKWVASGAKRSVAIQQLELAEQRQEALQIEVREGSRSRMAQLDNERVVFERRASLALAERDLQLAAMVLSLWYRDNQGSPIVPSDDRLPSFEVQSADERELSEQVELALERPDVRAARYEVERANVDASLRRNSVLPQLDGQVLVRQDLGDYPTEVVLGAELELPLFVRKSRGELARSKARVWRSSQVLRGLEDQVEVEVASASLVQEAAQERIDWAERAAERASQVLELERRSWTLGASDLFVLLQREEKLAKSRKDAIDARLEYVLADVSLRAAVGRL